MPKPKLLRVTTIPLSLNVLLKGQLRFLNQYFEVIGVAAPGAEVEAVRSREGIEVRTVNMEREIAIGKDITSLRKLWQLFKKERPQIVHANTPKGSLLSMIAAKYAGVPVRIYTVTGLRFEGFAPSLKRRILVFMERLTCAFATHIIPEGNGVKNALVSNNITSKPLAVVGNGNINGVDSGYFSNTHFTAQQHDALREKHHILPSDFVYCFVGRLVVDKGIAELVAAFKQIATTNPAAKLLLIGPVEKLGNALPEATINAIEQHPNIITTGFVADIRPYLNMSDVFVFPSYREGFPNVVLQAGAMELPCIVTDINGSNEIIEPGKNGLIVPVKNEEALLHAMREVLENKSLLQSLKRNSRSSITSRFEQSFVWNEMLKRYNEYLCGAKTVNR